MRGLTSIGIWLRIESGMVQTHQSAFAICGDARTLAFDIGDGDAAVALLDLRDLRIVADDVAELCCANALPIVSMPPTGWNIVVWKL